MSGRGAVSNPQRRGGCSDTGRSIAILAALAVCGSLTGCDGHSGVQSDNMEANVAALTRACLEQPENISDEVELNLANADIGAVADDLTPADNANKIQYKGEVLATVPFKEHDPTAQWADAKIPFSVVKKNGVASVIPSFSYMGGKILRLQGWFCELRDGEAFAATYKNRSKIKEQREGEQARDAAVGAAYYKSQKLKDDRAGLIEAKMATKCSPMKVVKNYPVVGDNPQKIGLDDNHRFIGVGRFGTEMVRPISLCVRNDSDIPFAFYQLDSGNFIRSDQLDVDWDLDSAAQMPSAEQLRADGIRNDQIQAALRGDAEAQCNMGLVYLRYLHSDNKARYWIIKAVANGSTNKECQSG